MKFLFSSLHMDMPKAPTVARMHDMCTLTPHYGEASNRSLDPFVRILWIGTHDSILLVARACPCVEGKNSANVAFFHGSFLNLALCTLVPGEEVIYSNPMIWREEANSMSILAYVHAAYKEYFDYNVT